MTDQPQLYLITPAIIDGSTFPDLLARILDAQEVACVRLAVSARAEDEIGRAADSVRDICHARDVALVIEDHFKLVEPYGLDGVHLTDGSRHMRDVRKTLGADAIIGSFCETSRHDGMTAAEIGADYVSFGPMGETSLGSAGPVDPDLFVWWAEMIETPLIAEGNLKKPNIATVWDHVDFLAVGSEIWGQPDPLAALQMLWK